MIYHICLTKNDLEVGSFGQHGRTSVKVESLLASLFYFRIWFEDYFWFVFFVFFLETACIFVSYV